MTAEERVRILREAKPNSWVAFSGDESRVLAYNETYSDAVRAALEFGESEPVMVKVPDNQPPASAKNVIMKRLDTLHWLLIAALIVTAVVAWITPYRYEHWGNNQLVRIHRVTGETDRLTSEGWRPMKPKTQNFVLER
jgi:hypothetical protein